MNKLFLFRLLNLSSLSVCNVSKNGIAVENNKKAVLFPSCHSLYDTAFYCVHKITFNRTKS